jgi:small subunit ribosomal protein S3Ae
MAIAAKGTRLIDVWRQKKWYKILSPALFGNREIGETVALEESMLKGRTLNVSMMLVTGDTKKQNLSCIFEITGIKNGSCETQLKKLEIAPSSVRRMVRKGKERIDMSFLCATKDGQIVRVKPFALTVSQTGNAVLTHLRKMAEDIIRIEVSKVTFDTLIQDIVSAKLQKVVRQRLNKIYPLKTMEIRAVEKAVSVKPLPPLPVIPEYKEEIVEETEEEKIEKKVKAAEEKIKAKVVEDVKKEEVVEAKTEKKPKKAKAKKEEAPKAEA